MCALDIVLYHPTTTEQQTELAKRVAQVHAQTVVERIKALSCPVEQKGLLIDAVKRIHRAEPGV